MAAIHIPKHNVPISPTKNRTFCAVCGEPIADFLTQKQRGKKVASTHEGCVDREPTFPVSAMRRPAMYGKQPEDA